MTNMSRRGLMATAGASGLAGALPSSVCARLEPGVLAWASAAGHTGSYAVGRRCLELGLVEANLGTLAHLLSEAVDGLQEAGCKRSPADLRRALHVALRSEFRAGDVVRVDGWVLSRSEARFYALSYLVAHDPEASFDATSGALTRGRL